MTEIVNRIIYHSSFYKQYGEAIESQDKYRKGQGVAGKQSEDKLYNTIIKVAPEADPTGSGRITFDRFCRIALQLFDVSVTGNIPDSSKGTVAEILKKGSLPIRELSNAEIASIKEAGLGLYIPESETNQGRKSPKHVVVPVSRKERRTASEKQAKKKPEKLTTPADEVVPAVNLPSKPKQGTPTSLRVETKKQVQPVYTSSKTSKENEPSTIKRVVNFLFGWMSSDEPPKEVSTTTTTTIPAEKKNNVDPVDQVEAQRKTIEPSIYPREAEITVKQPLKQVKKIEKHVTRKAEQKPMKPAQSAVKVVPQNIPTPAVIAPVRSYPLMSAHQRGDALPAVRSTPTPKSIFQVTAPVPQVKKAASVTPVAPATPVQAPIAPVAPTGSRKDINVSIHDFQEEIKKQASLFAKADYDLSRLPAMLDTLVFLQKDLRQGYRTIAIGEKVVKAVSDENVLLDKILGLGREKLNAIRPNLWIDLVLQKARNLEEIFKRNYAKDCSPVSWDMNQSWSFVRQIIDPNRNKYFPSGYIKNYQSAIKSLYKEALTKNPDNQEKLILQSYSRLQMAESEFIAHRENGSQYDFSSLIAYLDRYPSPKLIGLSIYAKIRKAEIYLNNASPEDAMKLILEAEKDLSTVSIPEGQSYRTRIGFLKQIYLTSDKSKAKQLLNYDRLSDARAVEQKYPTLK